MTHSRRNVTGAGCLLRYQSLERSEALILPERARSTLLRLVNRCNSMSQNPFETKFSTQSTGLVIAVFQVQQTNIGLPRATENLFEGQPLRLFDVEERVDVRL